MQLLASLARLRRLRIGAMLCVLALGVAIWLAHSADLATADIDDPSKVHLVRAGYVARNIVVGSPIVVCTDDYPTATGDAVTLWNRSLRQGPARVLGASLALPSSTCLAGPAAC